MRWSRRSRKHFPAVGGVEVAAVSVVVAVGMDQVDIDRTAVAVVEDPRRLSSQRPRCHELELSEVDISGGLIVKYLSTFFLDLRIYFASSEIEAGIVLICLLRIFEMDLARNKNSADGLTLPFR